MLFRKKIEPDCALCIHCMAKDQYTMHCKIKGVMAPGDPCRKFQYDPTKRIPGKQKAMDFSKYEDYDYSL